MSPRAFSIFVLVALACVAPRVARAQTILMSPGGQTFQLGNDGNLQNTGSLSLWTTGFQLVVNGSTYAGSGAPVMSTDGRTLTFGATTLGGLSVQRIAYVPATGTHDYVRWVNTLANSSGSAVSATVAINTMISGFGTSSVTGSSSGDMIASSADDWFTINPGSSPW